MICRLCGARHQGAWMALINGLWRLCGESYAFHQEHAICVSCFETITGRRV